MSDMIRTAGNEAIERAIKAFNIDRNRDNLLNVLEAIRQQLHDDGQFIYPIEKDQGESFYLKAVKTDDGRFLQVAFTSPEECEKGEVSENISNYIDVMFRACLEAEADGFIINPWGESFVLPREFIKMIFEAEAEWEKSQKPEKLKPEDLEDGSLLKEKIHIFNEKQTRRNLNGVMQILRDSLVWIPCNAVLSDEDYAAIEEMVKAEGEKGLEAMVGRELPHKDAVHLVPDILKKDDESYFPVFTTIEEMGDYGDRVSKAQKHFLEALVLARNNDAGVAGVVINAFSEPLVLKQDLFETIEKMESGLK